VDLAHELAIQAATTGGGHPVPQLDAERANIGTASTFVALIAELWAPTSMILFESVQVNGGWVGK
jgi:beta-lactamase class A